MTQTLTPELTKKSSFSECWSGIRSDYNRRLGDHSTYKDKLHAGLNLGFLALLIYRIGRILREIQIFGLKQVFWFLTGIVRQFVIIITGIDIPYSAKIGDGALIGHQGNIVIGTKVEIGRRVTLHQGVTIGKRSIFGSELEPKLGDDVFIAPNVVILGPIKIGSRSIISANALIERDIPKSSIVKSSPIVIQMRRPKNVED